MTKYGHVAVAEQDNLRFIPTVFSDTGQIYAEFKALVREQIRHRLIDFEGEAKSSKMRAGMKWCVVEMHIYGLWLQYSQNSQ